MNRRRFTQLAGCAGLAGAVRIATGATAARASRKSEASAIDRRNPWDHYFVGAAYYPEWWKPEEWETDFREMHELGINTVRMGEFAWSSFEPSQGKFSFDWMDHAISVADRYEIDVLLATPTASVPPWLYAAAPDVLGANASGPYTYGGRKGYCTNSVHYLEASARITSALAEHYGKHARVIGWQLDNEPGFPFQCLDPNCRTAFQRWLQRKYGTLQALNQAWNGAFWSNEYQDWAQIGFPYNSAEGGWQPAISLDYRKFFSDSFLNHLSQQASILKRHAPNQFLFTNWPACTWSVDVFRAGETFLDATAWDNYVSAPGLSDFDRQYIAGFNNDFCRCASRDQHFLCGEQIAYVPPNASPEGLRLQAYINLAHGSHGHSYFEWRRPLIGGEQFRPSFIKGFDGNINPAKPVLARIGKEMASLGKLLANAKTKADVALLYDFNNEWAQGFWSVGTKNDHYDNEAMRYYNGFKVLQQNIDVIPLGRTLSSYRIVVAQNLRLIADSDVAQLEQYVKSGGTLVLNFRAATQNVNGGMRRALSPGPFSEMVGATTTDKLDLLEYTPGGPLDNKQASELAIHFAAEKQPFHPRTTMERLQLHGASVVAKFAGGRMQDLPAVVTRQWGKGHVLYVATDGTERAFYESVARQAARLAALQPLIAAPYGVEVTSRIDDGVAYYFLLNLTESSHPEVVLPTPMDDVLRNMHGIRSVALEPLGVAVLSVRNG